MTEIEKAYAFLGLLRRGGRLVIGTESIEHSLKAGYGLVLGEEDSSTVTRLKTKALNAGCLLFEGASKESLGQAVGFEVISAVLIADRKATKSFDQKWNAAKGVQDEEK
ncbi:MAG: hypothetical protein PUI76_03900 [Mollicutes bacterium]|nr:hypothetical protein [bacterium]MDD6802086.1 hypothetical protein [Mollicutes bacterium]MDD7064402.1 hypothetical protein [Mollicutes bacterium]MDY5298821.1 hypothetical protein [Candidatus Enteromonas sp.]